MKTRILQRVVVGGCVWAVSQMFFAPAAPAMQARQDGSKASAPAPALAAADVDIPRNETASPKRDNILARPADRVPVVNLKKIEADKITSFFVRANDSKRIQLSMLVAYKPEFSEAIQQMVGQKVTPLVFSVSTFPNRRVEFDPAKLRFEQRGRTWQPDASKDVLDVLPLDENAKFGGMVTDREVHQGVVLLPAWMNPKEPITLHYGDFHYLARFADLQDKAASTK
ncbi:MAG: hypothetical protein ACRENG_19100 [bacterium]